ncbi:hypothetical protein L596_014320 [Steinernema carpocapsae]|uniref:Major sperm protein n=1 Tax=Steinernema carpocapsae TaxID=34508 RepID=A0A4U5NCE3_STECR|nr:hypothetical protein L596_014320 [Steinernema carpocapsae]
MPCSPPVNSAPTVVVAPAGFVMACPTEMVFPSSQKTTTRTLVLRNRKRYDIVVKIRASDRKLLRIDPWCDVVRTNETRLITVTYKGLPKGQVKLPTIDIYARTITPENEPSRRTWIDSDNEKESQLAGRLTVITSKTYAALETLIDLPGKACMVESEVHPVLDVDDSDTLTARRVDSDTFTAARLRHTDMVALAKEEVDTCHGIDSDAGTARNINDESRCKWLTGLFDMIFPPADSKAKEATPPCGAGGK